MLTNLQSPPWMFNLEGVFLGFLGPDPNQAEYLCLGLDDEELSIKLPQTLRHQVQSSLKPGDRIRITGRSALNFETGALSLNAYQVYQASPQVAVLGYPQAERIPC